MGGQILHLCPVSGATEAISTNENRVAVQSGGRKCLVLQKDSSTSVALLTLDFP